MFIWIPCHKFVFLLHLWFLFFLIKFMFIIIRTRHLIFWNRNTVECCKIIIHQRKSPIYSFILKIIVGNNICIFYFLNVSPKIFLASLIRHSLILSLSSKPSMNNCSDTCGLQPVNAYI